MVRNDVKAKGIDRSGLSSDDGRNSSRVDEDENVWRRMTEQDERCQRGESFSCQSARPAVRGGSQCDVIIVI